MSRSEKAKTMTSKLKLKKGYEKANMRQTYGFVDESTRQLQSLDYSKFSGPNVSITKNTNLIPIGINTCPMCCFQFYMNFICNPHGFPQKHFCKFAPSSSFEKNSLLFPFFKLSIACFSLPK